MNNLNSTQRSHLCSQAHHLEPIVFIGKNGITEGTLEIITKSLDALELIKIKFHEYKDEKKSLSYQIAESTESHVVGIIGHTVILFRQNSQREKHIYKLL